MRLFLAFRVFFAVLFSRDAAQRVAPVLAGEAVPTPKLEAPKPQKPAPKPKKPVRSEALTLLAALQREARFLDFIQEPFVRMLRLAVFDLTTRPPVVD